jgi:signal transduction histidine kinase
VEVSHDVADGNVKIRFADHGIGIPKEDITFIFEEGYRAENAMRRRPAGTGLGLSYSRSLMRAMDGELDYIPSNDKTIFEITLCKWEA